MAATTMPGSATTSPGGLLLVARGITKRFGGLVAVRSVDFNIPEGSIVSLIGPNGAGKTTFFNVIAGVSDPSDGVIEFRGDAVISKPRRAWAEPLFWFIPPALVLVVGILLVAASFTTLADLVFLVTVGVTVV